MAEEKREKPTTKHIEKFTKDEIIKQFSDKINNLPDGNIMGVVKEFPFFTSDEYETLQFTVQTATKGYVERTLQDLKNQIGDYEKQIKELRTEYLKEEEQKERDKKEVERLYNQINKNKQNYFKAMKIFQREEELKQKGDKLVYKEEYLKGIKDSIKYHEKVLNQ